MAEAASSIPVLDIGEMLWRLVDDATAIEPDGDWLEGVFYVHV